MDSSALALKFVAAINRGDIGELRNLIDPAHVMIDSLGRRVEGAEATMIGWRSYFEIFPDYRIEIEGWLADNRTTVLWGTASATLHRHGVPVEDGVWAIPAAWRAVVDEGRLSTWQVFADNTPVSELLRRPL